MARILITGITGRIGLSLLGDLEKLFDLQDEIFLLESSSKIKLPKDFKLKLYVEKEFGNNYDLAIHLAAISDTTYCAKKENETQVRAVNIDLTKKVCDISRKVIFMSTDYVFNGKLKPGETFDEYDSKDPVNEYGKSKAEGEEIVLSHNGIVIRVETMMGTKNRVIDAVMPVITGEKIDYLPLWSNNSIRPSYYPDFLEVLKRAKDRTGPKIYHVSCSGKALSRLEMAEIALEAFKEFGGISNVEKLKSCEAPETKTFILGTDKTRDELKVEFTDSREAIRKHIARDLNNLSYKLVLSNIAKDKLEKF